MAYSFSDLPTKIQNKILTRPPLLYPLSYHPIVSLSMVLDGCPLIYAHVWCKKQCQEEVVQEHLGNESKLMKLY